MSLWQRIIEGTLVEVPSPPAVTAWEALFTSLRGSTALTPGKLGRDALRAYQNKTVEIIKSIWADGGPPGVIIALEPGAGKTVSTLTAIRDLLAEGKVKRVLLVAPLLVAETVWDAEIEEWEHLTGLRCAKLTGDLKKRSAAFEEDVPLHIINKELVPWLWDFAKDRWPYDCLVIDEASMLKNGKKRTPNRKLSRFGALAQARKHFTGVVELTGTPAPNGVQNLWGLSYIIDQGDRLGKTQSVFNERWMNINKYTFEKKPKPGAEDDIMSRIKDIMVSLDPADYSQLPPLVENNIRVKLPPKVMDAYRKFKKTLIYDPLDVEAVNAAVLTNKLLQACIAKDTEVLTARGWIPIQFVENTDMVWDGEAWVDQRGTIYKGIQPTASCYGINMTLDHKVLTDSGWREAGEVIYGDASIGLDRATVRLPEGLVETWDYGRKDQESDLDVPVRLREAGGPYQSEPSSGREAPSQRHAELWLQERGDSAGSDGWSRHDRRTPLGDLAGLEASMSESKSQGFQKLRRSRNQHAGFLVQQLRGVLGRCANWLRGRPDLGSPEQRKGLFSLKLPMGFHQGSVEEHARQCDVGHTLGCDDAGGSSRKSGSEVWNAVAALPDTGLAGNGPVHTTQKIEVFDLIDCGPRHRFVARGIDGPVIVHNCNGSIYDENGDHQHIHDCKLDALVDLHAECGGMPMLVAYSFKFDLQRILTKFPTAIVLNQQKDVMQTVRDWNAGRIEMLLAHPASAGHGLNIQKGSNISVWYGLTADLELFQQFNKRLWRSGQKASRVFSHRIIAEGTHDEDILPILDDKDAVQSRILRATQVSLTE